MTQDKYTKIYEVQKNYDTRIGKTWRLNRTYYKNQGKRVGNALIYHYYGWNHITGIRPYKTDIYPKYVTDKDAYGLHYDAGEYKRNGWWEYCGTSHTNKRISSKRRRSVEKREFQKMLLDLETI